MQHVDALREKLPDVAKDLRLNLQSVLKPERLTAEQNWSVALACSYFLGQAQLTEAILADAKEAGVSDAYIEDAQAAAALMAMNTVYYRFRSLLGKSSYDQRPARLRMQRMAKPLTSKGEFELFALACAILAGCGTCIKAHEASVLKHEFTEEHVNDVARLAAVLNGVATALQI